MNEWSQFTISRQAYVSLKHETDKVIVYERAGLLFVFNFHPTKSYADYRVGVEEPGDYQTVLSSDEKEYGGFNNIRTDGKFFTTPMEWNGRKNWLQVGLDCITCVVINLVWCFGEQVYIPSRTCIILAK